LFGGASSEPRVAGACAERSQAGSPSHSGGNGGFGGGWQVETVRRKRCGSDGWEVPADPVGPAMMESVQNGR
jgi:hypothetical protein